MVLFMEDQ